MKNKAINTLQYSGIVTLSQSIGPKKVKLAQMHNVGGTSLFDFFSDCLIGTFNKKSVPNKIKLVQRIPQESAPGYIYESASGFIGLYEAEKLSNGLSGVRYSFIIPKDMLEAVTDFSDLGLGLYTSGITDLDLENYSAFCPLNLSRSELTNASLVVDWELIITNK